MTAAIITPTDGTEVDLFSEGIKLIREGSEELFPTASLDDRWADSSDEGSRFVSSVARNPVGQGQVTIQADDVNTLWENVTLWERMFAELQKMGGSLTYTPPDTGPTIEYVIQRARLLTVNSETAGRGWVTSTFELTYEPYGRLEPVQVVTNETAGSDPLLVFDVPALDGSADALGTLTLTDTEPQARQHLEGGLESKYANEYDAALLWAKADTASLESASSQADANAWGANAWQQTLDTASTGVCTWTSAHIGRFRLRARVKPSVAGVVSVRCGYSVRGGGVSYLPWVPMPDATSTNYQEVDLGVVSIQPPITGIHSVSFSIYAIADTGTPTINFDFCKMFPAERYFKARGDVGDSDTVRSGRYAQVSYNAILTETATDVWAQHPQATGSYLRIPVAGGRMAVAMNLADLDTGESTVASTTDDFRADLTVIPRVILLGG